MSYLPVAISSRQSLQLSGCRLRFATLHSRILSLGPPVYSEVLSPSTVAPSTTTPFLPMCCTSFGKTLRLNASVWWVTAQFPQEFQSPVVMLPLLKECGQGTTSLVQFLAVPATTRMFSSKPCIDEWVTFPKLDHLSTVQNLRVLDEISVVSFSVNDHAVQLQAKKILVEVL